MTNLESLRTEQALQCWRAAVKKDPDFAQALALIGYLSSDPAEQASVLSRAKRLQGRASQSDRLLITWISGVHDGDAVAAIAAMNDLLSLYPNDGRLAFLAGRIPRKLYAQASSPMEGRIAASTT